MIKFLGYMDRTFIALSFAGLIYCVVDLNNWRIEVDARETIVVQLPTTIPCEKTERITDAAFRF